MLSSRPRAGAFHCAPFAIPGDPSIQVKPTLGPNF